MKHFKGTQEQESLVVGLLREKGNVTIEQLVDRGLSHQDAESAVELAEWGYARAVTMGVRHVSEDGQDDPIFLTARNLGLRAISGKGYGTSWRIPLFAIRRWSSLAVLTLSAIALVLLFLYLLFLSPHASV